MGHVTLQTERKKERGRRNIKRGTQRPVTDKRQTMLKIDDYMLTFKLYSAK